MKITDFSTIEAEFVERVHKMVWCNAATIDSQQRPRSRILHPIWEALPGGLAPIGTPINRNIWRIIHMYHWRISAM